MRSGSYGRLYSCKEHSFEGSIQRAYCSASFFGSYNLPAFRREKLKTHKSKPEIDFLLRCLGTRRLLFQNLSCLPCRKDMKRVVSAHPTERSFSTGAGREYT